MTRVMVVGGVVFALLQVLGRISGTRRSDRTTTLPGDELVPHPTIITNHAATLPAPPREVWPWLVQMGWHQGGWYTSRWVDRLLFPANRPAAEAIIPELQNRRVGDFVPDGPPEAECGFIIERMEPGRVLVLHSTTHLPLSWRRRGARLDWTWTFHLTDVGGRRTRLLFRTRGTVAPAWIWLAYQAVIVPADFVMATQMLRGLERRVAAPPRPGAQPPADRPGATAASAVTRP
jgi:hypothetical protein